MEIEGRIILDLPLQSGTSRAGNPWKKKDWVLETFGNYPRKVCFGAFGDRVDTLNLEVGKSYVVSVDVESREYNGKWYTDVRAYAARPMEQQVPGSDFGGPQGGINQDPFPPAPSAPTFQPSAPTPGFTEGTDASEDLPF